MDTKALEDLITLAETGSFSKAAERRFVTQPAFSRRIQSLENWFGVDLVDRSNYPAKLTHEGEAVFNSATIIIEELNRCKQDVGGLNSGVSKHLSFAMPHSLSIGFFPKWRSEIEKQVERTNINVVTGNIHDTAQLLDSSGCDFVLFYSFDLALGYNFSDPKFNRSYIGTDSLIPVYAPDSRGNSPVSLAVDASDLVPYLSWSPPTLISHALAELIRINKLESKLKVCYQNQLAAALKEEALLGNGLAWLPFSWISEELKCGKLVRVSHDLDVPIKIRIACNSKALTSVSKKWWEYIEANLSI